MCAWWIPWVYFEGWEGTAIWWRAVCKRSCPAGANMHLLFGPKAGGGTVQEEWPGGVDLVFLVQRWCSLGEKKTVLVEICLDSIEVSESQTSSYFYNKLLLISAVKSLDNGLKIVGLNRRPRAWSEFQNSQLTQEHLNVSVQIYNQRAVWLCLLHFCRTQWDPASPSHLLFTRRWVRYDPHP